MIDDDATTTATAGRAGGQRRRLGSGRPSDDDDGFIETASSIRCLSRRSFLSSTDHNIISDSATAFKSRLNTFLFSLHALFFLFSLPGLGASEATT